MAVASAWVIISRLKKDKTESVLELQPLVTCSDCKYGESVKNAKGEPMIECGLCNEEWLKEPGWFCADGERRETE